MSSQGPVGKQTVIQGDASNWTQLLKRRNIADLLSNNTTGVKPDLLQSSQLQIDYRLGAAGCGASSPYPRLRTGQGC